MRNNLQAVRKAIGLTQQAMMKKQDIFPYFKEVFETCRLEEVAEKLAANNGWVAFHVYQSEKGMCFCLGRFYK